VAVKRSATGDELVWLRGFPVPERYAAGEQAVAIVEDRLSENSRAEDAEDCSEGAEEHT
jgi:hypothetical protein